MKSFITNVTLVRLFSWVRKSVILVVSFLMKPFTTILTNPRFVSIVYPHVGVESGAPVECFATSQAFVWLLVGVNDLVSAQSRSLSESFTTNFAHKRPSTCDKQG